MKPFRGPRREQCYWIGKRAALLTPDQAARAWAFLSKELEAMGDRDMPKFKDLLSTVRKATITGRQKPAEVIPPDSGHCDCCRQDVQTQNIISGLDLCQSCIRAIDGRIAYFQAHPEKSIL